MPRILNLICSLRLGGFCPLYPLQILLIATEDCGKPIKHARHDSSNANADEISR